METSFDNYAALHGYNCTGPGAALCLCRRAQRLLLALKEPAIGEPLLGYRALSGGCFG